MNLSNVNTFLVIAETGQLNRAAELLNVTQSTVTARLNNLEEELGQVLFHRRKSGAEFTSAGFRFHRYAQLMVDVWRQAKQETALSPAVNTVFNFGCHPDLWPKVGEVIVEQVRNHDSDIAVSAWQADTEGLERWLSSGLIDAALYYSPTLHEGRQAKLVFAEQRVLVSRKPRPLMRWDPAYIYVDAGEDFRKNHAKAYPDGDTAMLTISSSIWAREYLIKHGGSGYIPYHLIRNDLKEGSLHEVEKAPVFTSNAYLVMNHAVTNEWHWLEDVLLLVQKGIK